MCAHWSALFFRTLAFTLAPLAARSGGTLCWALFLTENECIDDIVKVTFPEIRLGYAV